MIPKESHVYRKNLHIGSIDPEGVEPFTFVIGRIILMFLKNSPLPTNRRGTVKQQLQTIFNFFYRFNKCFFFFDIHLPGKVPFDKVNFFFDGGPGLAWFISHDQDRI